MMLPPAATGLGDPEFVIARSAMELTAAAIYDQAPVRGSYTLDATLITRDGALKSARLLSGRVEVL